MGAPLLHIKMLYWKDEQKTSILCSIDQVSMAMPSTYFFRLQSATFCKMIFFTMETRKEVQQLPSGKAPCTDRFLPRFLDWWATHGRENTVVSLSLEEEGYHTRIRMPPLTTYTSGKEIIKSVTTAVASLSYQWPERCWQNSFVSHKFSSCSDGTYFRDSVWIQQKDMIFKAGLQKKMYIYHIYPYMKFADLNEAFDAVSRNQLLKTRAKNGCPSIHVNDAAIP